MEYKNLIVEKRDDHIAIVTLNRPEQLNTLSNLYSTKTKFLIA